MTIVGLISDTHGLWRPEIATIFAGVDLILHAGDVGGAAVLQALRAIAPVDAVYGNVDDPHDPSLAAERATTIEEVTIHVSHGNELGSPTCQSVLARYDAQVVVFGHTHKPMVRAIGGRVVINPGAAGPRRFNLQPSVALLTIDRGGVDAEIVYLSRALSSRT